MSEVLAREIIAKERGDRKLAFSFQCGKACLYISKDVVEDEDEDGDEKILITYHVNQSLWSKIHRHGDGEKQYADLEGAVNLVRTLVPSNDIRVDVHLYDSTGDIYDEVGYLGRVSSSELTCFLQEKIKSLDVVSVETM